MKKWIPDFLSAFHKEVMKSRRYKKSGRTFSRDMGKYWERIYFQGCRMIPFCFYINVGVEFKDIHGYDCRKNFVLIPSTHWAVRIRQLVPAATDEWIIQEDTDRNQLTKSLSALIPKASVEISARIDSIRHEVDIRLQKMNRLKFKKNR